MKKAIIVVAFFAIIAGVSCSSDRTAPCASPSSFIGKWKIDSLHAPDSSSIGILLMAMAFSDSASHHLEFSCDSVTINSKDSVEVSAYSVDAKKEQLQFGNEKDQYHYHFLSDSSLQLSGTDSTILFLKRK